MSCYKNKQNNPYFTENEEQNGSFWLKSMFNCHMSFQKYIHVRESTQTTDIHNSIFGMQLAAQQERRTVYFTDKRQSDWKSALHTFSQYIQDLLTGSDIIL